MHQVQSLVTKVVMPLARGRRSAFVPVPKEMEMYALRNADVQGQLICRSG